MLTSEEHAEVWDAYRDSRLFAAWKPAESELDSSLRRIVLRAGERLFRDTDQARGLYLMVQGALRQTIAHEGVIWLQWDLGPGDICGQRSVYGGVHGCAVVALTEAVLYELGADDLRTKCEGNDNLLEELLHLKRASRLRSIPLLRDLTDEQVQQMALLFEEQQFKADESLPLQDKPGLWVIDYGQVGVAGPAGMGQQDWQLTAGNFFLTSGVKFGSRCAATEATAKRPSRLFYLPVQHSDRLIRAFPDIGRLVHAPLDIAAALHKVPLFSGQGMDEAQRRHLAQYVAWTFVPHNQNVTVLGAPGQSLVILRDGAVETRIPDEQGRLRPAGIRRKGEYYGEAALLRGVPHRSAERAVSGGAEGGVPVVRGADVLTLDRRDVRDAFADRRDLWRAGADLFDRFQPRRGESRLHAWQSEGENVIWYGRGHIFWLLAPELALIAAAAVLLFLVSLAPVELQRSLLTIWLILLGILAMVGVWFVINYFDDWYVVTNRRVTRRDRQLVFFAQSLMEAPIGSVQDVTINANFWGRVFDFGDVTIRTAAKVGALTFAHVSGPEQRKRAILEGRAQALASAHSQQRELLRRGLLGRLQAALLIPERQRALVANEEAPVGGARGGNGARGTGLPSTRNTWLARSWRYITQPLPQRLRTVLSSPPVQTTTSGSQTVMRKHPIALLKKAWAPFLTTVLLFVVIRWLPAVASFLSLGTSGLVTAWFFLTALSVGWLAWQFVDYRNDIYVLTDDKIIDIEMKPLGLRFKRREGSLERVQTVDARQDGILPLLLNYGNVIIRTAAADEGYDFIMVPNPKFVQGLVFQKLDALRQKQETKKVQERQRELIEGFEVYKELHEDSAGPRAAR